MRISICGSSLIVLIAMISYFEPRIEVGANRSGKNIGYLEHVTCRTYSHKRMSNVTCKVKYIDRNNLRGYVAAYLPKPIDGAWLHGVIYYKYNTYQRIATEYWDDLCAWLRGNKRSFFLDFMKPLFKNYTNMNHSCPYTGLVFAKVDNISVQHFILPQLVPAGRYKIEANITASDRKTNLVGMTLYGSISDHRVEVV